MQAIWWVIFAISIINYIALAGFVIPKIIFKPGYNIPCTLDSGLKNYKEKNGRTIVYQPQYDYKKFVTQYIISERNFKKVLLCKLNANISYIDYDIVLFDGNDKAFNIINIKENIIKPGYSGVVELPKKTMYAMILVNSANDFTLNNEGKYNIPRRTIGIYAMVTCALLLLQILFLQLCLINIFGAIFTEAFFNSSEGIFYTFFIGAIAVIVNFIVAWQYAKSVNKNNRKKSKNSIVKITETGARFNEVLSAEKTAVANAENE